MLTFLIEQFSIECRKTKTKVITLANHKRHRQSSEPIKTRSIYKSQARSAGKRAWANHDWLWFYLWLAEQVARDFQAVLKLRWQKNHQKNEKNLSCWIWISSRNFVCLEFILRHLPFNLHCHVYVKVERIINAVIIKFLTKWQNN